MLRKLSRLFVIKNRIEAFFIIYALALGASERGAHYLTQFPGFPGKMLFIAANLAVFMAGGKILDALTYERTRKRGANVQADAPGFAKNALRGSENGQF